MISSAKSCPPLPPPVPPRQPILDHLDKASLSVITAPAGYLPGENLAVVLSNHARPLIWLRLGPEDRDPATFLQSLISAAQRVSPGVGCATLELMRYQPGPLSGWHPLFTQLAIELAEALPSSSVLVIERAHLLNTALLTLSLLSAHLLPTLPQPMSCVLIAEQPLPQAVLPVERLAIGAGMLRLELRPAQQLVEQLAVPLGQDVIHRALELMHGQLEPFMAICDAVADLGSQFVDHLLPRARSPVDALSRIAEVRLALADPALREAVALALRLEYDHCDLGQAALGSPLVAAGSWRQPLTNGWGYLRPVWREPLQRALRANCELHPNTVSRATTYLAGHQSLPQAVRLCFDSDDPQRAAALISQGAELLMSHGQWDLLDGWLQELPAGVLRRWPWLVYASGELAAFQGQLSAACRAFALATTLFGAQSDAAGTCQSLLAESTLAFWQNNGVQARDYARRAAEIALAAEQPWYQGWVAWQLGCLAAVAEDLDNSLVYFQHALNAAAEIGDPAMLDLLRQFEELALHKRELHLQQAFYRQNMLVAEQAAREVGERLRGLIDSPLHYRASLLCMHNWSQMPLMLKFPLPAPLLTAEQQPTIWGRLLQVLGRWSQAEPHALLAGSETQLAEVPASRLVGERLILPQPLSNRELTAGTHAPGPGSREALVTTIIGEQTQDNLEPAASAPDSTLTAHLLGTLRVLLNDNPVESWPSVRGRSIFKYLLCHRSHPTGREVLMELFWPETSPEAARNSLNVAIHGLRQAFLPLDEIPIVIFQRREAAYQLNPALHVWLDVEEFEQQVRDGRRHEEEGQFVAALACYESATSLYQGDFLADDLYEEWPVLDRERLRLDYLDTLDRQAQIYFGQGQYAACARLCQLILARDNCREDSHSRLMRCYSRLGQHHLALRQFQECARILQDELGLEPSPALSQLYEQIRHRERI